MRYSQNARVRVGVRIIECLLMVALLICVIGTTARGNRDKHWESANCQCPSQRNGLACVQCCIGRCGQQGSECREECLLVCDETCPGK